MFVCQAKRRIEKICTEFQAHTHHKTVMTIFIHSILTVVNIYFTKILNRCRYLFISV